MYPGGGQQIFLQLGRLGELLPQQFQGQVLAGRVRGGVN